jgi:hypothetical protein
MKMFLHFQSILVNGNVKDADDLEIPDRCTGAQIMAIDNDIRYTMDGSTTPSDSVGMVLMKGDAPKEFDLDDLRNMKFIRGTSSNAYLGIHFRGVRDTFDPNNISLANVQVSGDGEDWSNRVWDFKKQTTQINEHNCYKDENYPAVANYSLLWYAGEAGEGLPPLGWYEGVTPQVGWYIDSVLLTGSAWWQSETPTKLFGNYLPHGVAVGTARVFR